MGSSLFVFFLCSAQPAAPRLLINEAYFLFVHTLYFSPLFHTTCVVVFASLIHPLHKFVPIVYPSEITLIILCRPPLEHNLLRREKAPQMRNKLRLWKKLKM